MSRLLPTSACLALFLIPAAAHADWEYTRWGMTPDQVVAASEGKAWRAPPAPSKEDDTVYPAAIQRLAASRAEFAGISMHVAFMFRDDGLIGVQLGNACTFQEAQQVEQRLQTSLGAPTQDKSIAKLYRDVYWTSKDRIRYAWTSHHCLIFYEQPK